MISRKMETKTQIKSGITRRKTSQYDVKLCPKEERNASLKKVSTILQKAENDRTVEDEQTLGQYSEIVADLKQRWQRRDEAKRRVEEIEEPLDVLEEKCKILAKALAQSEHLVVYTGAGISTAARIPDYRGTNGIWTRLQQGKEIENHDLTLAEPTYTHMALSQLYHKKLLKYVVSQNCDGLHLRSGLPRTALSELHGNMYIEVCKNCKPVREYWRLFDVTENTARYSHKTMRRCYVCSHELVDTIVHFGERGNLQWPLNWPGACKNANAADTILCLGSSLKVLKRYPWLWQMYKPAKKRPNLYIVNLQWTPKDDCAMLKIHGKCDAVMKMVMKYLGTEAFEYEREKDPIFAHSTFLCEAELHTTSQPTLKTTELNIKTEEENELSLDVVKTDPAVLLKIENEPMDVVEEEEEEEEIKDESETEEMFIKTELDNSINLLSGEQDHAFDLTMNKSHDHDLLPDEPFFPPSSDPPATINCDSLINVNATKSSSPHLNGSSSINRTLSETTLPNNNKREITTTPLKLNNIFSIDSILQKKPENSITNLPTQNIQNLMAYYEFANTLIQNQMLNYMNPGFYPYQTSFLYPGFHSIINPLPYLNYDFKPSPNNNNTSFLSKSNHPRAPQEPALSSPPPSSLQIEQIPAKPACEFCHDVFASYACLYYQRTKSEFVNKLERFSKKENCNKPLVCVCCDYTTEEDSDSDENTENKFKKKVKRKCDDDSSVIESESPCENIDESNLAEDRKKIEAKQGKIQAGWFGKGYRKNRRQRKK